MFLGSAFGFFAAFAACDRAATAPDPERLPPTATPPAAIAPKVQRELEELAAEAGVESVTDPPPPSGDLKSDVESFTTLDACVRTRTPDPLLGDAIDALGYDTFTRDACRILLALKEKNPDACMPIVASTLRARCETYVAVATGDPKACPLIGSGRLAARDPVCLARANRDERLCAAALSSERTRCRALVLGQKKECGRDAACVRQVDRFKSLFETPASHAPRPTHLHVELVEQGRSETTSFELEDVAAGGAIVRVGSTGTRVSLGTPKTPLWPSPDAPGTPPKLFLEFLAPGIASPAAAGKKGTNGVPLGTSDLRLDLLVPKVAVLSGLLARDTKVDIEDLSVQPEGPIKFKLESTLHEAPRNFRVKLDVETFVRERAGTAE